MRKVIGGVLLIAGLLAVLGAAGHEMYENRVTDQLKTTLIAAVDPGDSLLEMRGYIHDARTQVKTKADRKLFEQVETAVNDFEEAAEETDKRQANAMHNLQQAAKEMRR